MNKLYDDNPDIRRYEQYKLKWMIDHGFTLSDLIAGMEEMICEYLSDDEVRTNFQSLFADWEYGAGFAGGSIWPCFEEYLQSDVHGEVGAGKYLLISVCERDIMTAPFPTLQAAREQMLSELKEEFCKGNSADDWEKFARLPSYVGNDFCFAENTAWLNLDNDWNCDWLIVEIS